MIESFLSEINCIINNKITKPTPVLPNYITFEDSIVKQICVENWGSNGEITYEQAAAVTDLGIAFNNNTEITSFDELQYFTGIIKLGKSLEEIETEAEVLNSPFYGCISLTSIILPESLQILGVGIFADCPSLISITIPYSVTSIGHFVFHGCSGLTTIISENINPPTIFSTTLEDSAITNIYIPAESVNAYKTAPFWSNYASIIEYK